MSDYNSSLPVRTQNDGDVAIKVVDATIPSQQLEITSAGRAKVDQVKLDSATDSVEITQAAHDDLNANANLQVGNADVANGNPVPVSDAGGSLTVDAADLDIRDLAFATDKVDVSGSSVTVSATDLDIRDLAFATDSVDVSGSSVTVSATDLDVRDLTHVSDSVKIGDGTDFLAVNSDGSLNVIVQDDVGTEVVDFDAAAAVAANASSNHDQSFANASKLFQVFASASGKMKIEVQVETGAATAIFNTLAVGFNSTANPNIMLDLAKFAEIPAGARVRVIRTNRDNQAQDLYSTIVGILG